MLQFRVNDMSCEHCVKTITKAVTAIDAEASLEADVETKLVRIDSAHPVAELIQVLDAAGYPATMA
jgi:copper chaperone